jgi:hypothetical protein
MVARLSAGDFARLAKLRSRSLDDASIALLDAWALVADVLTFYQERIANECYLRTATERRSLVELARLVGYRARPGASAATYLAFTLENEAIPGEIQAGTRVNSVPGPGETMVAFETSETITARREWNAVRPLLAQPQTIETALIELWLKGADTRLKPGDCLIIDNGNRNIRFVYSLHVDHDNDRTLVRFAKPDPPKLAQPGGLDRLEQPETVPPRSGAALPRSLKTSFAPDSATWPKLLAEVQPVLGRNLFQAMRNAPAPTPQPLRVYAMRVAARPWGHNAPLRLVSHSEGPATFEEWDIEDPQNTGKNPDLPQHLANRVFLDNDYEMTDDSLVVIDPGSGPQLIDVTEIRHVSLNAYGLSGKSVRISWGKEPDWLGRKDFTTVRTTRVFAGSELLELAEAPIVEDVDGDTIRLDSLYDGLEPGRWVIVEGERTDIVDERGATVPGVVAAELVMVASVRHEVKGFKNTAPPPGEVRHTVITLAGDVPGIPSRRDDDPNPRVPGTATGAQGRGGVPAKMSGLAYRYKRGTVVIHANVAPATHGETRSEVLGSGDASVPVQSFALKQPPLTHVSAATPSGIASTLKVRVNDLLWHEAPSLAGLDPTDRKYVTREDDTGVTSVIFGNGVRGARLPTGRENVRALYRSGIGRIGNVAAGRLSLLATRPLGVKGVVNPLPATGGADRDSAASIRRNAPIALMALDRLVATPDYENFSRNFGGVGKARATRDAEGVRVIVAGVDDIPIAEGSELIRNLETALRSFGDRQVAVRVEPRKRLILVMQAGVRIDPDYEWAVVEPKIRAALLEAFSFERTELGDCLPLGRALAAIQAVPGVVYSDIDVFDRLSESDILQGFAGQPASGPSRRDLLVLAADEIAYLAPNMPDTLILQEVPK